MVLPSHKWDTNDVIIRQRANGIIQQPEMVESGCVITAPSPTSIQVTGGWVHVGGMREWFPSAVFPVSYISGFYYIFAELTADIDGSGDLIGTKNIQYAIYTSPPTYTPPNYGTLVGIVASTTIGAGGWLYIENTNRNVDFLKGYNGKFKTLGNEGCDYQTINHAVASMADGEICICFPDADYNLHNATTISGKKIGFIAAWCFDPDINQGGFEAPLIPIAATTNGVFVTDIWIDTGSNAEIYFKGFEFNDSLGAFGSNGAFRAQGDSKFVFEKCRINTTFTKPTYELDGGYFYFNECYTYNDTSDVAITTLALGNAFYSESSRFISGAGHGLYLTRSNIEFYNSKAQANSATKIAFATRIFSGNIEDSYFKSTSGTAFEILASPSGSCFMKNCEFDSANIQINTPASGFQINYSNIKLEGVGNPTISSFATWVRQRTPVLPFEPVEIQDVPPRGTSFPATPSGGDFFYRTDLNECFVYDSSRSKWLSAGLDSGIR